MSDSARARQILDEIAEERAKGNRIRRIVGLVILAFILLFAFNIANSIRDFDNEVLMVEIQKSATTTVWPLVSKELDKVAKEAVPAIQAAFTAEAEDLLPALNDKIVSESAVFQKNVNKKLTESLDAQFLAAANAHKDVLREQLPQFTADSETYDELMAKLHAHARGWAQGHLDSTFEEHVNVLQSINDSFKKLQVQADAAAGEDGAQSMDDVMMLFMDILNSRLNEEG
jgi:hypothetical protein